MTTPTLDVDLHEKKTILDHDIKTQDDITENTWTRCCLKMDKRAVQYFSQLGVIGGIIVFDIVQLLTLTACESQVPYMSLLTFLVGILIPNPKLQ